ncbi:TPA: Flp pilus assembly complex ATPase component TadA [Burkholderia vietnamiensis]|uniref:ATPase, T2SS/T4P/T4SS family n=1 Tax=Burkholderia vietnamiensis TaxID=60552 RepID=UPI001B9E8CB9|nr:ATPase, T2SS/T4P/T4SS family [Burkholderia vietnamiensis]MBR8085643.1 Flp pilus assembly complex ATPase component TadA [Burkholderia vietnamiensis]HDR9034169.1 Flp pilus assembly complex ATPase component TadA [Burkholderia vietnamiensis]
MFTSSHLGKWFSRLFVDGANSARPQKTVAPRAAAGRPVPARAAAHGQGMTLPNWARVQSVAELPVIHRIYTAAKADFEVPESLRAVLVVTGHEGGTASILIEPDSYVQVSRHVDSLRERLRKAQVRVAKTAFAERDLIAAIYKTEHHEALADDVATSSSEESRLFDTFIRYGIENGATDLHVIVKGQHGVVKYRVDGEMEVMKGSTKGVYTREQLHGAFGYAYNKLMADRTGSHSSFTSEDFQSCMIPYRVGEKSMNLRWQSSRGFEGFTVYIRFLLKDKTFKADRFQDFGYEDDQAEMFARVARTRKGMILIVGETNSGKSTALTHYIESLPERDKLNIIMVEDPTEKAVDGTSLQISLQRTLSVESDKTPFREVQGVLMRSDPCIIAQGEIRDIDSGTCAKTLLESGHQVLATSHAPGVMDAFVRLTSSEIGFSMETLTRPRFWSLVVAQSLVPKLCSCSQDEHADETIPHITEFIRERFQIDTSNMRTKKEGGCPMCGGRGTKGLTVVAEMYQPTRNFLQAMRRNDDFEAERIWRSEGDKRFDSPNMRGKTMFEHALYKAYTGLIDPRQVETFELFDQYEIMFEAA